MGLISVNDARGINIQDSVQQVDIRHNNMYFHIVPVKGTTQFAQHRYNARTETNEFWELLPTGTWYTPIYYCSTINEFETFAMIMALFRDLDRESLSYSLNNKPSDFLKQHIITDGLGRLTLCNKHLLRQTVRKNGSKARYVTSTWIRGLLRALFPKLTTRSSGTSASNITTNTPKWAIDLLHEQHRNYWRDNGNSITESLLTGTQSYSHSTM
nr:GrBNV_gp93-like protein [Apis mellifera nudivirus]